ncbi:hypothetical protein LOTGIDRAFT_162034 [Lottia gigantea]|uniref:ZMYM2-like/QRICH1 C-terminal domain-containing protein n=1 Tax=Lottia gigantea TaxID=225164 RepID=V4BVG0_LOTGI|nr:hypothetical protein LOTGIDRAFT_162034 [Lottia gigantea]ESO93009.1 hypothetical protein LOTGIDRAFT_162034 [Lottia gigantea]
MWSLVQSGIGVHKKKADIKTKDQEDMLWEQSLLGEDTPQKLIDTVFYLKRINLCLRGGKEHHSIKIACVARPKTCNSYYVRPPKYPKRDTWYCAVPVGHHTLSGGVKKLWANAGFDGFYELPLPLDCMILD